MKSTNGFARIAWLSSVSLISLLTTGQLASAACSFAPTAGDDTYVCDSGTAASLTDASGNNSLSLPAGGTGQITGNVTFGAGTDSVVVQSGTIGGTVQQGGGIDDYRMTGGTIGSLSQGDGLDTFTMSGGHIIDFFEDGDNAVVTGGRIGRVNMKLDDNYYNMSGGTVDRNVVTGLGRDTIIISGGVIGGNISTSSGVDSVTVSGGSIGNGVKTGEGDDTFAWSGGIIYNAIQLEGGNDTATLTNLTNGNMGAMTLLSGGTGIDRLTFSNVSIDSVTRFDNWESIAATNDTELRFEGNLVLGDAGTGTGTFSIDSTSTVFAGSTDTGVHAFTAGQLVNVVNSGRIDLSNGNDSEADSFTIAGNYSGNNGLLFLDTVLGDDASASDKLVISGGTASGTTGVSIINQGGTGDLTTQNGILVVEGINGANTGSGTFSLNDPVAAGAYEYFLFKGGVTAGTAQNWYLRSTINTSSGATAAAQQADSNPAVQPEAPEAEPPAPPPGGTPPPETPPEGSGIVEPPILAGDSAPVGPPAPPLAAAADAPDNPEFGGLVAPPLPGYSAPPNRGATPVEGDNVALYRIEVPTYSVAGPAARQTALATLGTFHERRGVQGIVNPGENFSAAWGRAFGQSTEQSWEGTVDPSIDGNLYGIQAGLDVLGWEHDNGHRDIAGLFFGYSNLDADIKGQALGWNGLDVGTLNLDTTSFGGYWTHIGPGGWYLDAVLMGSWFGGDATSDRGVGIDVDGTGITASLEGGYPIVLSESWTIEPQAQLIWQNISLDDQSDAFSDVAFDNDDGFTGRLGMRIQGKYQTSAGLFQPYVKANLWHGFSTTDSVFFGPDAITTEGESTSLELGAGVVHEFTDKLSAYAVADYTFDVDGANQEIFEGNIGLSVKW
jgi:type V secretory pathway adhesin AidA